MNGVAYRTQADCPHPDCHKVMQVPQDAQAGEYPCVCHGCTVRLTWATRMHGERVPHLELVDKTKE